MLTQLMLAARTDDPRRLRYPLLATPKLDGVRCAKVNGKALTRSFKTIQNRHIREAIEASLPDGVDGELVAVGGDFSDSQSAVMRRSGCPEFKFQAFDWVQEGRLLLPYRHRVNQLVSISAPTWFEPLIPDECRSVDDLLRFEEQCLDKGFEGVMMRSPDSPYKQGRSTLREGWLVKLKRYMDSEAVVLGFQESMENCNELTRDAFGYAQRLGGRGNCYPKGTLGGFLARDLTTGVEFRCGTGLTAATRQRIWDDQATYLGKVFTYTYQACGTKNKPRFPSFKGFRED